MATIENSISIAGPLEPVFDLVTSARFWPRWHPATRWVGGVIERPFRLGDLIHEQAQFGDDMFSVTWRISQYLRPTSAVLEALNADARIEYGFHAADGQVTFRRALTYDETVLRTAFPDLAALQQLMHSQSETALAKLKRLVESILHEENSAPVSQVDDAMTDRGGGP